MSVSEADIKAAFDAFDADGSGNITRDEIAKVCEQLGVDASGSEITALIEQADSDNDGKISYDEFKGAIMG